MKIDPIFYEDYLKNKFENINIIFLYGTNTGLVDLTYKKTVEILKIDTSDPSRVLSPYTFVKYNEMKESPNYTEVVGEVESIDMDNYTFYSISSLFWA